MTTQMVFNIDKNLKKKAMTKAKKLGVSMSFILNHYVKGFVDGKYEIELVRK